MSNLYTLIESLNSYLEIFENLGTNREFISFNKKLFEKMNDFLATLSEIAVHNSNSVQSKEDLFDKLKEFAELIEILKKLSNDKVLYDKDTAIFSLGLEKEDIDKLEELYNSLLDSKDDQFAINLNILLKNEIKSKLFNTKIKFKNKTKYGNISIYSIDFSNYLSSYQSPNKEQKEFIPKDFRDIFGIILGFAEKININFDKSVFYFIGSVEDEKDKDKNRRLSAYHIAHIELLQNKYDDIDKKELRDAFRNYEVHPFLYRENKDRMYISISKDVDLTTVSLDIKEEEEEIEERREEAWDDFAELMLNNSDFQSDIIKSTFRVIETNYNFKIEDLEKVFDNMVNNTKSLERYFSASVFNISDFDDKVLTKIKYYNEMYSEVKEIIGNNFEKNYSDEDIVKKVKNLDTEKNSIEKFLTDEKNITETLLKIKHIQQKTKRDFYNFVKNDLTEVCLQVRDKFLHELETDFLNGEYDDWIEEEWGG